MYDIVILNACLANACGFWDVGVKDGTIAFVEPAGKTAPAKEQLQADGRLLLPGLVDAHVHTRDPGYTYKEDFSSATMAAANGGVTTIMAMPNCNPPLTTAAAVHNAAGRLKGCRLVNVHLVGGASAAAPAWMLPVAKAGVIALDVYDDLYSYGTRSWLLLFQEAKQAGLPLCFYLMDAALEQLRKKELSAAATPEAEQVAGATNGATEAMSIARIFPMAAYFGVPVVIRMVSTADAIKMIRHMRALYPCARVYVEVCVHYLFLTRDSFHALGGKAHIHPPLRAPGDVDALWGGIKDGTVDYIASDHAPHAAYEKSASPFASASGVTGLETMLALLLDANSKGKLGLEDIQRLCCENPAKIYGLAGRKGSIRQGCDADFVLVDTDKRWTVHCDEFYTRGAPSPFDGWSLMGKPCVTICGGKKVMENNQISWNARE